MAATLFLVGEAAPFAPATFASFLVMPLLYWFPAWSVWIQAAIAMAVVWLGVLVSTRAETYYGHDARPIVIDEVAGMIVTFLLVPWPAAVSDRWLLLLAGFVLFRIFDVAKPFPAGRAQNLPRGTGVMMDDVIAGVYANAGLRVLQLILG
jgi:phosphatidylglycerophosphatase A